MPKNKNCCNNIHNNEHEPDVNESRINFKGLICYCFKYSKSELFNRIKKNQEEEIVSDIKLKMRELGCFCETANPTGKCCLNDVKAFIYTVKKSI